MERSVSQVTSLVDIETKLDQKAHGSLTASNRRDMTAGITLWRTPMKWIDSRSRVQCAVVQEIAERIHKFLDSSLSPHRKKLIRSVGKCRIRVEACRIAAPAQNGGFGKPDILRSRQRSANNNQQCTGSGVGFIALLGVFSFILLLPHRDDQEPNAEKPAGKCDG